MIERIAEPCLSGPVNMSEILLSLTNGVIWPQHWDPSMGDLENQGVGSKGY